jgi:hypothetical protein
MSQKNHRQLTIHSVVFNRSSVMTIKVAIKETPKAFYLYFVISLLCPPCYFLLVFLLCSFDLGGLRSASIKPSTFGRKTEGKERPLNSRKANQARFCSKVFFESALFNGLEFVLLLCSA